MGRRRRRTIAIDFDGVLHRYSGFVGVGVFGPPMPGARERVDELRARGHDVVIFTTRPAALVREWLATHDWPALEVTAIKRPFWCLVDDRAIRFDGDWGKLTVQDIEASEPYWVRQRQKVSSAPAPPNEPPPPENPLSVSQDDGLS